MLRSKQPVWFRWVPHPAPKRKFPGSDHNVLNSLKIKTHKPKFPTSQIKKYKIWKVKISEKRGKGRDLLVTSIPIMKEKTEKIGIHVAEILAEVRVFMFVLCSLWRKIGILVYLEFGVWKSFLGMNVKTRNWSKECKNSELATQIRCLCDWSGYILYFFYE